MSKNTIKPIDSDTILVPTDFTEVAENALGHASLLAKIFKKQIVIMHVLEKGMLAIGKKKNAKEDELQAQLNDLAKKNSDLTGVSTTGIIRYGNIFDAIGETADEVNAALVVMGTHGVIGMQKVVGSKALRVITNASRPFVVVQKKEIRSEGYKNIVLPIDFSKQTKQKLVWAVELSKVFNSTFHVLADFEDDEFTSKAVNNNIAYAENHLRKNECNFTVARAPKGDFAKETIRFSSSVEADLIVIMTNQDQGLSSYIIGPYEQNVIANDAQIPVMTLNPVDTMNAKNGHLFNFGNY
jgi:nucleotide-binding universal stress UspA family protein